MKTMNLNRPARVAGPARFKQVHRPENYWGFRTVEFATHGGLRRRSDQRVMARLISAAPKEQLRRLR